MMNPLNVLVVGTGEYTTGYVHGAESASDKGAGVVALTLFDLRRRGLVDEITLVGTNGTKFPGIRSHLKSKIESVYRGMDVRFHSFPDDSDARNPKAYVDALNTMSPGDAVCVFTPDDTHFEIARRAVRQGCHVLVAKPLVKSLSEHLALAEEANKDNVLVAMEVHKRWDPIYVDARDRIRGLGDFGFFSSYMSQPKSQLETFRLWAGKSSDISYYLNAHHIDFNVWAVSDFARPLAVHASAATGYARSVGIETEDSITLTVTWENVSSKNRATAVYTASWVAPQADVHSQQRFFYQGQRGEVSVDQAHRGYSLATDEKGFASPNPMFMKYTPNSNGEFAGQTGYGYRSIEDFLLAASGLNATGATSTDTDHLATIDTIRTVTAILEAGRLSLDSNGRIVNIDYDANGAVCGVRAD